MIKLLGAGIILLASAKIGTDFSKKFHARVDEIKAIRLAFETIRSEIGFSMNVLGDVLEKASANLTVGWKNIFNAAKNVDNSQNIHVALPKSDVEKIKFFLESLGKSDADMQIKNIDFFQKELAQIEERVIEERNKFAKLSLTLALSAGTVICILML